MKITLRERRREKRFNLEKVALKSGISTSTLSRIENRETVPNMKQMEKLAEALDVYIEDLYESERKKEG